MNIRVLSSKAAAALVVGLTGILATHLFATFLSHPRSLWVGLLHDRSGHYGFGFAMALALEHGDVARFFIELEKATVWPPLHGLLVAVTQLLSGNDWRLAVLPSLLGWAVMLIAVYGSAWQLSKATGLGVGAGALAFIFAALSPAHRAYAADIMLESLGAGLTMLILACHARTVEDSNSTRWWRATAIALTLLFFEKYNYWLIAALALFTAHAPMVAEHLRQWNWREQTARQLRQPLNWLVLALAGISVVLLLRGREFSISAPSVFYATYVVLFASIGWQLWRAHWRPTAAPVRILYYWHVLPVAVYFLLPKRLTGFVGFLSPTNYGDAPARDFLGALRFYASAISHEYYAAPWMAVLSFALVGGAIFSWRKMSAGARAVLLCAILGALLTILHPNQKVRFVHSWLPAIWIASGLGAAQLLQSFLRFRVAAIVCALGVAAVALANPHAWLSPGFAPESGARGGKSGSLLDWSDRWLDELRMSKRVAFISTQPGRPFINWTFRQRHPDRSRFEWPRWQNESSAAQLRSAFESWIRESRVDTLVVLEIPPGSAEFTDLGDNPQLRAELPGLLAGQNRFAPAKRFEFDHDAAVSIWTANPAAPKATGR